MRKFQNKMGLNGCKWSSINGEGFFLELEVLGLGNKECKTQLSRTQAEQGKGGKQEQQSNFFQPRTSLISKRCPVSLLLLFTILSIGYGVIRYCTPDCSIAYGPKEQEQGNWYSKWFNKNFPRHSQTPDLRDKVDSIDGPTARPRPPGSCCRHKPRDVPRD